MIGSMGIGASGSPPDFDSSQQRSDGCAQGGMLFVLSLWILLAAVVTQLSAWFVEQAVIEGSFGIPDIRWLINLLFSLAVMVPSLALRFFARGTPLGRYYLAFGLAGLFALLQTPTRFLPMLAELETSAARALLSLLFLLVISFWPPRIYLGPAANWRGTGLALLAAATAGLPWVVWGALGSIGGTLLALLAALLFGVAASRLLARIFFLSPRDSSASALFSQGGGAFFVLLVMVTGFGVNGNQALLIAAVPILGWGLAALAQSGAGQASGAEDNSGPSNWPVIALLSGLAVFWPSAFFDPDELAAAINFGLGDLLKWMGLSVFLAFVVGLLLSLALMIARRWVASPARRPLLLAAAGLAWAASTAVYLVSGQPGFHGDRLYVILAQQADLTRAAEFTDGAARRAYVYQTLSAHALETQASLRSDLDRLGFAYQPYYLENALEVDGGPLLRLWLLSRPEVDRVVSSPVLRPLPAAPSQSAGSPGQPSEVPWNLRQIGADRVWQELGVTGQGIIIGQMDSGVQADHPELADSYRGRSGEHDYNWLDPWYGIREPYDYGGHGTHTLGTVLGNQVGVAPDAEWIGCVNLARNLGNPALYLDCLQFTFAPYPPAGDPFTDGRPDLGAHITNNSWGCPEIEGCDPATLVTAAAALRAAGIFTVASAGNSGNAGCETVTAPIAIFGQVYSVGAVDSSGKLAPFSSLGPVTVDGSGRLKPEIAAPGVDVVSAYPGSTYSALTGTSMAGPHVAGVVALMWSANSALIGDIERTEQILNETAAPYNGPLPDCVTPGTPNNAVGYGIVDAYQAVLRAIEYTP